MNKVLPLRKSSLQILLLVGAFTALGCASIERRWARQNASPQEAAPTAEVAPAKPATHITHYAVVVFNEGTSELSPQEQQALKRLAAVATKEQRPVQDVKVLAWADNDDPQTVVDKESPQSKIAEERAAEIKKYLRRELRTAAQIELHNMAIKPGTFNQLLKGEKASTKTTFENAGNSPLDNGPKSSLAGSKASKAIVLVVYEDKEKL